MGWFYTQGATRQDIIQELTGDRWETDKFRTLAKYSNGFTQLFAVHEVEYEGEIKRFIALYLLQRSRYGWGYKPMDEACHPYYYACPLKYLEMAPETCKEWRDGVRNYWKRRKDQRRVVKELTLKMQQFRDHPVYSS